MKKNGQFVCAWCKREMGPSAADNSHGICTKCFRIYFPEQLEYIRIHEPKQYAKFIEDERREQGARQNPGMKFPSVRRIDHILEVFRYYYKTNEGVLTPKQRERAFAMVSKALKHMDEARVAAHADEEQAEDLLDQAHKEVVDAIHVLHGE